MTKKMLIDAAHPEEVRVAVLDNGKVEDFDFESESRKPLRGNIYLARVTRVEPSLQAAFVEYGGNRHGFLAFSEIHPDYYQIPVSDRLALQEAEAEVVELAAQLELTQRGDDEDDQDDDAPKQKKKASDNDEHDDADDADDSSDDDDDSSDPVDEIAAINPDEEEEEEEDGEEDDANEKKSVAPQPETTKSDEAIEAKKDEPLAYTEIDEATADEPSLELEGNASDSDDTETTVAESVETSEATSDDDNDSDSADKDQDGNASSGGASRQALFERYKEAKRKRANLLRNYKIQEVIKRRQILLIQVVKEERGNKGAALTTYMSLAGRYCVLMPNTARGGGISRKIPHSTDRRRLRRVVDSLDVPQGMGLIIRTAGAKRTKIEVKRDYDYLLRLWENIRTLTLKSIAPCLIYEEASLIKRAIRDLYDKDISEVQVEGDAGYREAKDFMKMLMPSHAKFVQPYKDKAPLFLKHGVEAQLDGMYQPSVRLKSGGYIVINQTEALIAIDVNSGRATRERNIEQTALKTNIEAAHEAARQFRLRDLAGLVVLDFIDMEEPKNNRKVEKALKDAVKHDRARIQLGRISNFGLLEMSRQRRRSGIIDGTTQACPTCSGAGVIRSAEMAALRILRALEGEAISGKAGVLSAHASLDVTVYVLNHHRDWLKRIEDQYGVSVHMIPGVDRTGDDFDIEKSGTPRERSDIPQVIQADQTEMIEAIEEAPTETAETEERDGERKKRRRRRRRKDKDASAETSENPSSDAAPDNGESANEDATEQETPQAKDGDDDEQNRRRRRRGRRGGRRNRRGRTSENADETNSDSDPNNAAEANASSNEENNAADNSDKSEAETSQPVQPVTTATEQPSAPTVTKTESKPVEVEASANGAHPPKNAPNGKEAIETVKATEEIAAAPVEPEKPKSKKKGWWRRGSDA